MKIIFTNVLQCFSKKVILHKSYKIIILAMSCVASPYITTLLANIRLGWKGLPWKNTSAYWVPFIRYDENKK